VITKSPVEEAIMGRKIYLCALLSLAGACGDSGGSSCEKAGTLLCEKACACGESKCVVATDAKATISFKDLKACKAMYVELGCMGGGNQDIDHEACHEALQGAQCAGTTPTDGVLIPEACNSKQ
jgi:hypothetical protein